MTELLLSTQARVFTLTPNIMRELRTLIAARESGAQGDTALLQLGVWDKRLPLVKGALRRLKLPHLKMLLRQAGALDRAIKGMRDADPWEDLAALVLGFAGAPTLSPSNLKLSIAGQG